VGRERWGKNVKLRHQGFFLIETNSRVVVVDVACACFHFWFYKIW
jgi:hypothetical protein